MSTRQRRHGGDRYARGSGPAISGGTILVMFCIAKCIFDMLRARNQRIYQTDTTESERSFEPYIPRRKHRERRHHRNQGGRVSRAERSPESVQDDYWAEDIQPATPRSVPTTQSEPRRSLSTYADSRYIPSSVGSDTGSPRVFECQICFDEKSREDFPSMRMTKQCKHEPTDCCNACLAQAISTSFEGNMWDNIRCPICDEKLQFQDMAELAPRNVFERYDMLHLRRAVEQELPNFRWCVSRHCSYGEEHAEDSFPIIECSACGILACSHHNVPWHHSETCSEYDQRIASRQARAEYKSEKAIKRVAKRCPGCRRFINKNGGCNHMTCLCGRQFCWTCLHDFPGHIRTCPHHLG